MWERKVVHEWHIVHWNYSSNKQMFLVTWWKERRGGGQAISQPGDKESNKHKFINDFSVVLVSCKDKFL